jgi:hypothetical protein
MENKNNANCLATLRPLYISICNQVIERIKLSLISYTENDTWNDAIDEIVKDEWKKHLREKENE